MFEGPQCGLCQDPRWHVSTNKCPRKRWTDKKLGRTGKKQACLRGLASSDAGGFPINLGGLSNHTGELYWSRG